MTRSKGGFARRLVSPGLVFRPVAFYFPSLLLLRFRTKRFFQACSAVLFHSRLRPRTADLFALGRQGYSERFLTADAAPSAFDQGRDCRGDARARRVRRREWSSKSRERERECIFTARLTGLSLVLVRAGSRCTLRGEASVARSKGALEASDSRRVPVRTRASKKREARIRVRMSVFSRFISFLSFSCLSVFLLCKNFRVFITVFFRRDSRTSIVSQTRTWRDRRHTSEFCESRSVRPGEE